MQQLNDELTHKIAGGNFAYVDLNPHGGKGIKGESELAHAIKKAKASGCVISHKVLDVDVDYPLIEFANQHYGPPEVAEYCNSGRDRGFCKVKYQIRCNYDNQVKEMLQKAL